MMGARAVIVVACVWALAACEIRIASQRADDTIDPACGNAIVDPGEVCDDGNNNDGDGCSANCKSDETCGNGVIDVAMGETCDDGNQLGGDGCSADCKSDETCGNGVLDLAKGETCDEGDLVPGDGCSANCQSNEQCGNGQLDLVTSNGIPEDCDTAGESASCNLNCTFTRCGDGIVNTHANEECDDANTNNADGCDNQCHIPVCGNDRLEGIEECDDGNGTTTDACVNCRFAFCGDGFTQAGVEQCDDANANVNDACTVNCQAAFCGDGFLRIGVEDCDDGNTNDGDGCDANCRWEPRSYVAAVDRLFNQDSFCDGTGDNRYDGCGGSPFGFSWDDSSPFSPSTVEVTFNRGIDCYASSAGFETQYVNTTNINDVDFQDVTITSEFAMCDCFTATQEYVLSFSGGGYNQGGTNTFTFGGVLDPSGFGVCVGISFDPNFGGFAQIRVIP